MNRKIDYKDPYWWIWSFLGSWKLLIFLPVIIGVIAFSVAQFILPKWFEAESEVMPLYRSGDMGGAFANMITGMMSMGGGGGDYVLPMMTTPSDLWGAIIKSNSIVDTLITEFDLAERYKQGMHEDLRDEVRGHIDTEVTGEGILIVRFEDKHPVFAATVTNAIVEHLDRINRDLRSGTASQSREFVEERLRETEISLAEAESTFTEFQKEHGTISLEDQTRVAIENASQVRAELLMAEVQLGILTSSKKSAHGEVGEIRSRISALKKQLNDLKMGENEEEAFGLVEIPDLAIEYARLFREMKIQELLFEYLTQQYEQARIEEKKDLPILQVLSKAKVPEKKARPKRIVVAGLSFFGALILTGVWIAGSGALERMHQLSPETYAKLNTALGGREPKKEKSSESSST